MHNSLLRLFGLLILLTVPFVGVTQKTDKVSLKNGDIVTGEIKTLKFGKLRFDMTGPGIIEIKWEEIVKIKSDKKLQVSMRNGELLITSLDSLFAETQQTNLDDIVEIVQIKDRFLKQLDGDVNLGFNFSKSNSNFQFNLNTTTTYRKPKEETNIKINSVITNNSKDTTSSKKQDITLDHFRRLKKQFYLNGIFGWQQNTQLGLRNRFILNGVGGKIIINDNHKRLLTGGGISYNVEQSDQSSEYKSNVEALAIIQFKKFHYSSPKISLDAQYIIYPGITDWGRVRMDLQVNTKIEIFKDFNVGLVFYDLYDNRPPGAGSKNDYGINFTVGYEFGR
jgi:putative salt-induced outer membrane protein YdiY